MTKTATFAVKGETKFFFEDGSSDALLSMIMTLGAEISALSERLDTVINLLNDRSTIPSSELDAFQPTPEQQKRRDANRKLLVETLLGPLQHQADALADRVVRFDVPVSGQNSADPEHHLGVEDDEVGVPAVTDKID